MDIASTRLSPADEEMLRWYFNAAARDLGAKSHMGPMIDRLTNGTSGASSITDVISRSHNDMIHRMAEARTVSIIERRLARIGQVHERTLSAVYGEGPTPGERETYGDIGSNALPLSLLLLTARRLRMARADLVKWAKPETPPRPDTTGATTAEAKAVAGRAHAAQVRATKADWQRRRDEALRELRAAASLALDEASVAYSATRPA